MAGIEIDTACTRQEVANAVMAWGNRWGKQAEAARQTVTVESMLCAEALEAARYEAKVCADAIIGGESVADMLELFVMRAANRLGRTDELESEPYKFATTVKVNGTVGSVIRHTVLPAIQRVAEIEQRDAEIAARLATAGKS